MGVSEVGLLLSFDGDWLHTEEAELCCNHSLWPQSGFKNESSRWPGGPAGWPEETGVKPGLRRPEPGWTESLPGWPGTVFGRI